MVRSPFTSCIRLPISRCLVPVVKHFNRFCQSWKFLRKQMHCHSCPSSFTSSWWTRLRHCYRWGPRGVATHTSLWFQSQPRFKQSYLLGWKQKPGRGKKLFQLHRRKVRRLAMNHPKGNLIKFFWIQNRISVRGRLWPHLLLLLLWVEVAVTVIPVMMMMIRQSVQFWVQRWPKKRQKLKTCSRATNHKLKEEVNCFVHVVWTRTRSPHLEQQEHGARVWWKYHCRLPPSSQLAGIVFRKFRGRRCALGFLLSATSFTATCTLIASPRICNKRNQTCVKMCNSWKEGWLKMTVRKSNLQFGKSFKSSTFDHLISGDLAASAPIPSLSSSLWDVENRRFDQRVGGGNVWELKSRDQAIGFRYQPGREKTIQYMHIVV